MFTSNINELTDKHFPTKTHDKTHNRQTMGVGQIPRPNSSASTCMEGRWPSVVPSLQKLNKVNCLSKQFKQKYYDKYINGLKTSNPRNWWKGMKELLGCQQTSSDPPLLHLANQVCDGNLLDLGQRIYIYFLNLSDWSPICPECRQWLPTARITMCAI